jgi:16S rRNA (cytosine967-C5)-methyltransferase
MNAMSKEGTRKATARSIAARALLRVEQDQAFAAAALDAELTRSRDLDARERGLATELLYGVLRSRGALLKRLLVFAPRGISDPLVTTHLLVAAYQLLVLERIPAFAAVDAAVEEIGRARGSKVSGFANAVLRKLVSAGEKLDRAQAVRESVPPWLLARLESTVGREEAEALIGAEASPPRLAVRVAPGAEVPAWLAGAEPFPLVARARLVPEGSGDPRKLEGFSDGTLTIHEPGAQLVALALGARPGESVLDACAGRGQKTSLLREQIGEAGLLWATDLHARKLEVMNEEFARLKLAPPRTAAVDWSVGGGAVPGDFDRVLVDAPCTGTGTLRKRPEIWTRLSPEDPARLGELATRILIKAAERAKPGGRVVFAVCSVLPEEAERVVTSVASVLEPAPFDAPELAQLAAGATSLRLLPRAHGTDGYFVQSFLRRA